MSKVKEYIIFYDIDGVFCSARTQLSHYLSDFEIDTIFDPVAVSLCNKICIIKEMNVSLVCVSSWKDGMVASNIRETTMWHRMMRNAGFIGDIPLNEWSTTTEGEWEYNRAEQILKFFDTRHHIKDFIILDDSDIGYSDNPELKKRFVRTDSSNGITFDNVVRSLKIVENWE